MSLITTDEQPLRLVKPRSYTSADLETLARKWIATRPNWTEEDLTGARLLLSAFLWWLKQEEKVR